MFIELTDHLRCPAEHDEQFLILLPDVLEERWVRSGDLACPVCGRAFRITDGVFDLGDAAPLEAPPSALGGDAIAALSGLGGPGGYLVLVGGAAASAGQVGEKVAGVGLVALNPDPPRPDGEGVSVIRGGRIPLRSSSMRGVILGPGYADEPRWVAEAARVVLPGLRIVGEGGVPEREDLDILATADGCWVATRVRNRYSP